MKSSIDATDDSPIPHAALRLASGLPGVALATAWPKGLWNWAALGVFPKIIEING
jgi:hypothetical protein